MPVAIDVINSGYISASSANTQMQLAGSNEEGPYCVGFSLAVATIIASYIYVFNLQM